MHGAFAESASWNGVEGSVFEGIMERIRADRLAYLTAFFQDFYNLDQNLGSRVSEEVVRDGWNVASAASPTGTLQCVPTWLTDFRDDLRRIDVPTLVVHGDADRILPLSATGGPHLQAAIAGSRLAVIEGAPHGLLWTHADRLNPELVAFLGAA